MLSQSLREWKTNLQKGDKADWLRISHLALAKCFALLSLLTFLCRAFHRGNRLWEIPMEEVPVEIPMVGPYFCIPSMIRNMRAEQHTNSNFSPASTEQHMNLGNMAVGKKTQRFPKVVMQQRAHTENGLEAPKGRMGWICSAVRMGAQLCLMQCDSLLCKSWAVVGKMRRESWRNFGHRRI